MTKRFIACLLSIALTVCLTPFTALAVGSERAADQGSVPASDEGSAYIEQGADNLPAGDVPESDADFFSFVYVDVTQIEQGDYQQVAIGFTDAAVASSNPVLHFECVETGEQFETPAAAVVEDSARFDLEALGVGSYRLGFVTYDAPDGSVEEAIIPRASLDEGVFSVVEPAAEEQEGVQVTALSDSVSDEEVASLESTLNDAIENDGVATCLSVASVSSARARSGGLTVMLDPGHGGYDPGACGYGLTEADLNLRIATYCKQALEAAGACSVKMTRYSDVYVGLTERADMARDAGADLFVSIHINAGGGTGFEVWVQNSSSWRYELHEQSDELGHMVAARLNSLGLRYRGVFTRDSSENTYPDGSVADYYSVLRENRKNDIPAVLIEHGFIDNGSDASFLSSDSNLRAMGQADAQAIMEWLGDKGISREAVEAFVTRLYQEVLGRTPDEGGFEAQVDAMMGGVAAGQIAMNFFASPEFAAKGLSNKQRVGVVYRAMFDRNADEGGLAHWTRVMDGGCSAAAVVAGFVESREFIEQCAGWHVRPGDAGALRANLEPRDRNPNATAFASRMYSVVLGRTPDADGLNCQCEALVAGMSAGQIAMNFLRSPEFDGRALSDQERIEITYRAMLDRGSDAQGLQNWLEKISYGCSLSAIVAGFVESREFTDNCANWGVNRGDANELRANFEPRDRNPFATAFATRMYGIVLGRTADVRGLNSQCEALYNGMPAANLANNFFMSPEFSQHGYSVDDQVAIAYRAILGREPDSAGFAHWTGKMNKGMPLYYLIAGFTESPEFASLCQQYGLVQGHLDYDPVERDSYMYHPIMGASEAAWVGAMVTYFTSMVGASAYPSSVYTECPNIQQFCQTLYEEAVAEGVRADVVFIQSMHETGWLQFGGDVSVTQRNFAGLGATGNGVPGNSFPDVRTGLRAQVQHLKAYASTDSLVNAQVDSRFGYVQRGIAPYVEDLGGKWAVDKAYSQSLIALYNRLHSYL